MHAWGMIPRKDNLFRVGKRRLRATSSFHMHLLTLKGLVPHQFGKGALDEVAPGPRAGGCSPMSSEAPPRLTMSPQNSMRRAMSWLPIFFLPSLLIAGRLSAQTPTHVRMPMFLSAITVYGGVTMYMFGSANRVGG